MKSAEPVKTVIRIITRNSGAANRYISGKMRGGGRDGGVVRWLSRGGPREMEKLGAGAEAARRVIY